MYVVVRMYNGYQHFVVSDVIDTYYIRGKQYMTDRYVWVVMQRELQGDFSRPVAFYDSKEEAVLDLACLKSLAHWRKLYYGDVIRLESGKTISSRALKQDVQYKVEE